MRGLPAAVWRFLCEPRKCRRCKLPKTAHVSTVFCCRADAGDDLWLLEDGVAREHSEHRHGDQPGGSGAGKCLSASQSSVPSLDTCVKEGRSQPWMQCCVLPKMLTTRLLLWLAVLAYTLSVNIAWIAFMCCDSNRQERHSGFKSSCCPDILSTQQHKNVVKHACWCLGVRAQGEPQEAGLHSPPGGESSLRTAGSPESIPGLEFQHLLSLRSSLSSLSWPVKWGPHAAPKALGCFICINCGWAIFI